MKDTSDALTNLIKKYPRAIAHMRARKESGKFGLVFGAGSTADLGFPIWRHLVEAIARHSEVKGQALLRKTKSNTSQSQLLFEKYKESVLSSLATSNPLSWEELSARFQSGWRNIVRDALYKHVPGDIAELKRKDAYLKHLVGIIKTTPLTVTYNFDDTLERLLSDARDEHERLSTRGYRTLCEPDFQPYAGNAVIYHPNGYLPRDVKERPSDGLVFLEDSFGDQLIESVHGHYAALTNHYAHTTCLFVGVSLEDSTLKHVLRANSKLYPGHVHYLIRWLGDNETIDPKAEACIRSADFDVYNVISLFLRRSEIAALGKALTQSDEDYERDAEATGKGSVFRFFLTGSVAVGKSTAVSHFRCLRAHDEWLEPLAKGMEKDPSRVKNKKQIREIDQFVVEQWRLKNFNLSHKPKCGIHIVDRSPLDAFAFTPVNQWIQKARLTVKGITKEDSKILLCKGALVLMLGDPRIMAARAAKRGKFVEAENLKYRQSLLEIVYDRQLEGVQIIDTREKSAKEVAKEVARIVFLGDYKEFDFQGRLRKIEAGEVTHKKKGKKEK